jgi:hypothetical protein
MSWYFASNYMRGIDAMAPLLTVTVCDGAVRPVNFGLTAVVPARRRLRYLVPSQMMRQQSNSALAHA